jgi:small subunit ribosomal protein S17
MATQTRKPLKNEKIGQVVSTKMTKTIVVEVSSAKMGDIVRIIECRPLSHLKRWRLSEVVRRVAQVGTQPEELDVKA